MTEALAVMGILSVLAGLGVFTLRRRNHRGAVAGLAQEIFLRAANARATSVNSGFQVLLDLDPQDDNRDGQVLGLRVAARAGMDDTNLSFGPALDSVTGGRGARIKAVREGADLGGAPPAGPAVAEGIVFYPDGSARLRSTGVVGATIYLDDERGQNPFRVTIYGRTGFARLLDR